MLHQTNLIQASIWCILQGEKKEKKQSETSEILYCVVHPHDAQQTENVTSSACCFSLPSAFPPLAWDALVSVARKDVRDKR